MTSTTRSTPRRTMLTPRVPRRAARDALTFLVFLAPFGVFYCLMKLWPIVDGFLDLPASMGDDRHEHLIHRSGQLVRRPAGRLGWFPHRVVPLGANADSARVQAAVEYIKHFWDHNVDWTRTGHADRTPVRPGQSRIPGTAAPQRVPRVR